MIVFGASWCPYCMEEMPVLTKYAESKVWKDKNVKIIYDMEEVRKKIS